MGKPSETNSAMGCPIFAKPNILSILLYPELQWEFAGTLIELIIPTRLWKYQTDPTLAVSGGIWPTSIHYWVDVLIPFKPQVWIIQTCLKSIYTIIFDTNWMSDINTFQVRYVKFKISSGSPIGNTSSLPSRPFAAKRVRALMWNRCLERALWSRGSPTLRCSRLRNSAQDQGVSMIWWQKYSCSQVRVSRF